MCFYNIYHCPKAFMAKNIDWEWRIICNNVAVCFVKCEICYSGNGPTVQGLTDVNQNPQGPKHECELAEMNGTVRVELIT